MVAMIRPYRDADAVFLGPIHSAVFPDDALSTSAFHNYVSSICAYGGKAWVLEQTTPIGYALVVPVPGLPHIAGLKGCIAPTWQRKGLGSRVLRQVLSLIHI